ncbi:MAG: hypothetical protein GXP55_26490 [Deltaproteobacteria bacterium]|nr:hypothetical protein [Deltaproteobacteria bacterium]
MLIRNGDWLEGRVEVCWLAGEDVECIVGTSEPDDVDRRFLGVPAGPGSGRGG